MIGRFYINTNDDIRQEGDRGGTIWAQFRVISTSTLIYQMANQTQIKSNKSGLRLHNKSNKLNRVLKNLKLNKPKALYLFDLFVANSDWGRGLDKQAY